MHMEILGRILKTLVPKFRPDLSARLKDVAEKTGLRKAEIDMSCSVPMQPNCAQV